MLRNFFVTFSTAFPFTSPLACFSVLCSNTAFIKLNYVTQLVSLQTETEHKKCNAEGLQGLLAVVCHMACLTFSTIASLHDTVGLHFGFYGKTHKGVVKAKCNRE